MSYPDWPEVETTCNATRAGVECTSRTYYNGVKLSSTVTEENENVARNKASRALERKVRQRRAYGI
jgi:hypothetical protein